MPVCLINMHLCLCQVWFPPGDGERHCDLSSVLSNLLHIFALYLDSVNKFWRERVRALEDSQEKRFTQKQMDSTSISCAEDLFKGKMYACAVSVWT